MLFLGFNVVKKRMMNLFKGSEDFGFWILSGWIEKYKPALSKSDSSWDNSYCVRLVFHSIAFLDVFISGINYQNFILQTYDKLIYTGLLLNVESFTSFSYKISLIKSLIDWSFKICNNWNYFHNNIENVKSNLMKNAYLPFLIDKVIKK